MPLEFALGFCAKEKGAYVINLLACGRRPMPEEESRGGIEVNVPKPIEDPG